MVDYFVGGITDCAPFPTPNARAVVAGLANARAVSTVARVVPTESTVVTMVPLARTWLTIASRVEASPTRTPEVEPKA